jgi:hypothetical protein
MRNIFLITKHAIFFSTCGYWMRMLVGEAIVLDVFLKVRDLEHPHGQVHDFKPRGAPMHHGIWEDSLVLSFSWVF